VLALETFKTLDTLPGEPVTYLGLSLSGLVTPASRTTLSLLEFSQDQRSRQLLHAATALRNKYGVDITYWGTEDQVADYA